MTTMEKIQECSTNAYPGSSRPVYARIDRWDTRSKFDIRDARLADCGELAAIYNDAIRTGTKTMDTEPVDAGHFRHLLQGCVRREAFLVATLGSRVVAWAKAKQYSDRGGYRYACETSVYVADHHQNRGFGSRLLRAIVARAYMLEYRHIVAKVVAINEASIRFHERYGFQIIGRQKGIGFLNGAWQDVVIMQRVLTGYPPPRPER